MGNYIYQAVLSPDEEGGYDVRVPSLPGCFTHGDTYEGAAAMAADAMRTYVASLLRHGEEPPAPLFHDPAEGESALAVCFDADEGYIVEGEVVSAAEAARRLGVSAGRVTHMLASGVLDGYRRGRRTYVTVESIGRRLADGARPGRPRRSSAA